VATLRLLLDTVGLLCAAADPNRMSPRVRELVADRGNQVLVSAASGLKSPTFTASATYDPRATDLLTR